MVGEPWHARKRGAASTIASNKVFGGSKTKIADMSAASGRRMAVAGAIIGEKFTYLGANMKLGLYTISHPLHPLQRVVAKERNVNVKAAASVVAERKRQKMARAVDVEMRKRAIVRERWAARLQTAL